MSRGHTIELAVAALVIALWLLFLIPAQAQTPPSRCAEYAVIKNAINRHDETLRYRGITVSGDLMMEVYLDGRERSDRSFTVIVTKASSGISCIVFSGFGWTDNRTVNPTGEAS